MAQRVALPRSTVLGAGRGTRLASAICGRGLLVPPGVGRRGRRRRPRPLRARSRAADANGVQLPVGLHAAGVIATSRPAGAGHRLHLAPAPPTAGACFAGGGRWVGVRLQLGGRRLVAGGASAVRFQPDGSIDTAYRILSGTNVNCAGGPTPWGTWLSCEENGAAARSTSATRSSAGQGIAAARAWARSRTRRPPSIPATGHVYLTEDHPSGRLYRFVPTTPGDLTSGSLHAASVVGHRGHLGARQRHRTGPERRRPPPFNGGEGAWLSAGTLWFTTKGDGRVWELDLATQELNVLLRLTRPRRVRRCTQSTTSPCHEPSGDLFVAEDGGNLELCLIATTPACRTSSSPFLRVVGHSSSEVTGPAFSPDGTRLYFSSQRGANGVTGITYEVTGPFRTGRHAAHARPCSSPPDRRGATSTTAATSGTTLAGRPQSSASRPWSSRLATAARLRRSDGHRPSAFGPGCHHRYVTSVLPVAASTVRPRGHRPWRAAPR